jgi:hypothetical protein
MLNEQEAAYIAVPLASSQRCIMETSCGPCGFPADWQICLNQQQWLPICLFHLSEVAKEYQSRIGKHLSQKYHSHGVDTESLPSRRREKKAR